MRRRFTFGRSGFENKVKAQLEAAGVKYEYETEVFTYTKPVRTARCGKCGDSDVGQLCKYTPDFIVQRQDGPLYIEAKGYLDGPDRTKLRLIRSQYPQLDLRLLFMKDNIIKGTKQKTRYSEWASKYGFEWAIKEVPTEWLR